MVENAETNISVGQPAEEEYTTLGTVLIAAREARGLTIEQVASELRVESRFLTALEEDDLELFAAPVFVKGYVKHLAHRYELEYKDLLARYTRQTDAGDAPVTFIEPIRMTGAFYVPWLIGGLVLLLAIPAFWLTWGGGNPFSSLVPSGEEQPDPPVAAVEPDPFNTGDALDPEATATPAALPGVPESEATELLFPAVDALGPASDSPDPVTDSENPAADSLDDPVTEAPSPAANSPSPSAEPAEDGSSVPVDDTSAAAPLDDAAAVLTGQIVLSFEEDCWTEVIDGNGNALYYALVAAGTTLDIDGVFPLSFTLGNPSGVQMTINDQPYPVPAPVNNQSSVRFVVAEAP